MADFSRIANTLEGIIANQVTQSRVTQGVWEWYNALARIISSEKVTGTPNFVYTENLSTTAEASAVSSDAVVYGLLIDNPNASEAVCIPLWDDADGTITEGTTVPTIVPVGLASAITTHLWPSGLAFTADYVVWISQTASVAGLGGNADVSGTTPDVLLVYTA